MKRLRPRLTYANVIATLALFVALGGGAYAATQLPKNSVGAKQLKKNAVTAAKINNGAVTGEKINLSSLGTVPSASHADTATTASSATTASHADTATSADSAANAGRANTARSAATAIHADSATSADSATTAQTAATANSLAAPEPLHVVGQAGEPTFEAGWADFISASLASFYMDRQGIVHLQGDVTRGSGTNETIFVLPPQYAPKHTEYFPAMGNGATFAVAGVENTGAVVFAAGDPGVLALNGITWRAGQ
jgi:hypothetical protein